MDLPAGRDTVLVALDLGTTAIKAVALRGSAVLASVTDDGDDVTSVARRVLEQMTARAGVAAAALRWVAATGTRLVRVEEGRLGLPIRRVDEFQAIGRGGLHLSGLSRALVASMGTGTAFVAAEGAAARHLGGTALGGGTLQGLGQRILGTADVEAIAASAASGDLHRVDLMVADIAGGAIGELAPELTAANFGKLGSEARDADLALGLLNLVVQNVALMAAFVARNARLGDVVLTGKLALLPQAEGIAGRVAKLTGIRFLIPGGADYATAVGAGLCAGGEAAPGP